MFVKLSIASSEGECPRYFLIGTTDRSVIELGSLCTIRRMTESEQDDSLSEDAGGEVEKPEASQPRRPAGKYGLEVLWNDYYNVVERLPRQRSKFSVSVRNEPFAEIYLIGGINTSGSVMKNVDVLRVPKDHWKPGS